MTDNYLEKLKQIRQKYGCQNSIPFESFKVSQKLSQTNQQFSNVKKRSAIFQRPSSLSKSMPYQKGNPEKGNISDIYSKYSNNYDYQNTPALKLKQEPIIQRNRFNSTVCGNQLKSYNYAYNQRGSDHTLKLFRQNQIKKDGLKLNNYVKGIANSKTVSPLRQKNTQSQKYDKGNWCINNLDRVQDKIQAYLRR